MNTNSLYWDFENQCLIMEGELREFYENNQTDLVESTGAETFTDYLQSCTDKNGTLRPILGIVTDNYLQMIGLHSDIINFCRRFGIDVYFVENKYCIPYCETTCNTDFELIGYLTELADEMGF